MQMLRDDLFFFFSSLCSCWLCLNMRPEDTTRARKSHEREGVEYHFITKAAFEADIQNGKWVVDAEYPVNQAIKCSKWFYSLFKKKWINWSLPKFVITCY